MRFGVLQSLLWLCLSGALWAAPGLDIEAKIEQAFDPLPFGKPATLVLSLSWDEKWPFTPPPADQLELPGFTVIDRFTTSAVASPGSGREGLKYNIVFTRFEPGSATIPSLDFDTPSGVVKSPSLAITYKGAEAKAGDKPDQLRGPKEAVALSSRAFWLWLAKVVGLTLLGLLLLAALVRKLGLLERWLSPRSRALRQLGKLANGLDKGTIEAQTALLDMVEIVRVYLARTYGLVTREATSREIASQLTMTNRCQNIKPIAKTVLEQGDVAKFAQREPSAQEARDLLEQLRAALATEKGRKP
jgi:hypothetical protein